MSSKNTVKAVTALVFDTANLAVSFKLVGTLSKACFLLRITNNSANIITISYDGTNVGDYILANTSFEINAQTNAAYGAGTANFRKGLGIWVLAPTNSVGQFYVSGYYQG